MFSGLISHNIPLICWRNSSVDAAKAVLLMAFTSRLPGSVMEEVSFGWGMEGNVSGFLPAKLYLPSPDAMLIPKSLSLTLNVKGTSSRLFTMSNSSFEGTAMSDTPSRVPVSTSTFDTSVVSKSVALMVRRPSSKWK